MLEDGSICVGVYGLVYNAETDKWATIQEEEFQKQPDQTRLIFHRNDSTELHSVPTKQNNKKPCNYLAGFFYIQKVTNH
jgi:hypothetical protein